MSIIKRCKWISSIKDTLYIEYHDLEWGRPEYDEKKLFEGICLEGMQCGLSWITVLKKREEYRKQFFQFDPEKISKMTDSDIDKLMSNDGLIKNRLKLNSIISNAKAYVKMKENNETLSNLLWSQVNHKPIMRTLSEEVKTKCTESDEISKILKNKGFKFIGTTTIYAFMQAYGLVNDHCFDCEFRVTNQSNKETEASSTTTTTTTKPSTTEDYKIVPNVSSSIAGSCSGDFHVYRNLRRKEMDRIEKLSKEEKDSAENQAFLERREELLKQEDQKVKKKSENRKKAKQRKSHSVIRKKLKETLEKQKQKGGEETKSEEIKDE